MLRFAVYGLGGMGRAMALNLCKTGKVSITALCDPCSGSLERAAKEIKDSFGQAPALFTDAAVMQKQAVYDACVVAADPSLQTAIAINEMERGVHVLSQVPVTFSLDECEALIHTVEKTGSIFASAEQTRNWQFVREWRKMSAEGAFGKIIFAEGAYLHYEHQWDLFRNKQTGEPIVTNDPSYIKNDSYLSSWRYRLFSHPILYLPHTLSCLTAVTGGRVTKVSCFGTKPDSYGFPGFPFRDMETAIMQTNQDTVLQVKAGFTTPHGFRSGTGAHWYQIKGTEASAEWSRSEPSPPILFTPETGWQEKEWSVSDPAADETMAASGHGGADLHPILDFIDAVELVRTPELDVYTSVEITAPAIVAAQSSEQGGIALEVPDFRKH